MWYNGRKGIEEYIGLAKKIKIMERDRAIDIAKGITILLMILGHCDFYGIPLYSI